MKPGTGKRILAWVGVGVALCAACAVWFRLSTLRRLPADIPVLMYHRIADDPTDFWAVTPRDFEAQLAFLKTNGFHTILPAELVSARATGGCGAIACDLAGHPWRLVRNLLNPGVLTLFGSLLFLPLGSGRAWLPLVIGGATPSGPLSVTGRGSQSEFPF